MPYLSIRPVPGLKPVFPGIDISILSVGGLDSVKIVQKGIYILINEFSVSHWINLPCPYCSTFQMVLIQKYRLLVLEFDC